MPRLAPLVAVLCLTACAGGISGFPLGDRISGAQLTMEEGDAEAGIGLLAFDPARHSLDIDISMPLEQQDDLDVYIVTASGIRFLVLESFHGCTETAASRHCARWLPVLPEEDTGNWRVEADRVDLSRISTVQVDVTWVPLGG